jgi:8-oxo-dGTP diphosphatase
MLLNLALAIALACALAYIWRRKPYSKTVAYCPHCASKLVRKEVAGQMRTACSQCNFVHWNNPLPVVATLIVAEGGIVLVQRGVDPAKGTWCLPAGFMENGEDPAQAAAREVEEECGLKVEIKGIVCATRVPRVGVNEIILFFIAVPVGGTLKAGDDAVDAKVFSPDALPNIAFSTHRRLIELWWQRKLPQTGGLVKLD